MSYTTHEYMKEMETLKLTIELHSTDLVKYLEDIKDCKASSFNYQRLFIKKYLEKGSISMKEESKWNLNTEHATYEACLELWQRLADMSRKKLILLVSRHLEDYEAYGIPSSSEVKRDILKEMGISTCRDGCPYCQYYQRSERCPLTNSTTDGCLTGCNGSDFVSTAYNKFLTALEYGRFDDLHTACIEMVEWLKETKPDFAPVKDYSKNTYTQEQMESLENTINVVIEDNIDDEEEQEDTKDAVEEAFDELFGTSLNTEIVSETKDTTDRLKYKVGDWVRIKFGLKSTDHQSLISSDMSEWSGKVFVISKTGLNEGYYSLEGVSTWHFDSDWFEPVELEMGDYVEVDDRALNEHDWIGWKCSHGPYGGSGYDPLKHKGQRGTVTSECRPGITLNTDISTHTFSHIWLNKVKRSPGRPRKTIYN